MNHQDRQAHPGQDNADQAESQNPLPFALTRKIRLLQVPGFRAIVTRRGKRSANEKDEYDLKNGHAISTILDEYGPGDRTAKHRPLQRSAAADDINVHSR